METSSVDELREVNVASPLTGRCHDLLLIAQRRSPVFHLLPGTPRTIRSQGLKTSRRARHSRRSQQPKTRHAKERKNDNSKIFLYTNPPSMTTLKEIRKDAIEIGYIDQSIIDRLQEEIQADQQISLEEANFLFTIKKQFANKKNSPNWRTFFIDTITRFLLEDEDSPGVVDEQEAQ